LLHGTIFVFGSNLAGGHGKGAALHARQPTKEASLRTLPLDEIQGISLILRPARRPDRILHSRVTPVGLWLG
jgi:hypothetical protein